MTAAFRTVRGGHLYLTTADWVWAGAAFLLMPRFFGSLLLLLGDVLDGAPRALAKDGGALLVSTMLPALFAVLLALFLGDIALRRGWAGWGAALLAATGLSALPSLTILAISRSLENWLSMVQLFVIIAPLAILHAAILWLTVRLRRPAAVAARSSVA